MVTEATTVYWWCQADVERTPMVQADAYGHNPYGSDNFVVVTAPSFQQYDGDEPLCLAPSVWLY